MPARRTRPAVALLVAATFVLAGCAEPDRTLDDGAYVLVAHEESISAMMAIVQGKLVALDGCVGIRWGGHDFYPVLFPAGTSVEGDVIRVPGFDQEFTLGDVFDGGGGEVPVDQQRFPMAPCTWEKVLVVNPGDAFG